MILNNELLKYLKKPPEKAASFLTKQLKQNYFPTIL